jgi:hypothetical protein
LGEVDGMKKKRVAAKVRKPQDLSHPFLSLRVWSDRQIAVDADRRGGSIILSVKTADKLAAWLLKFAAWSRAKRGGKG